MFNKTAVAIALFLGSAVAGQDGMELLKKVAAAARAVNTYEIELVRYSELHLATGSSRHDSRLHEQGARSGKRRWELPGSSRLTISDGRQTWEYDRRNNEYTRQPAVVVKPLRYLTGHLDLLENARVVRQEAVELDAGPVPCTVVEADERSRPERRIQVTYWIDTQRSLPLKRVESWYSLKTGSPPSLTLTTTFVVQNISLNQPLPDSLFQFTAPEGAVEVKELRPGLKSPLAGQPAPDFSLKATAGGLITLASLRGSVVVLRFSLGRFTDDALPFLELLHRSFEARNVAVLIVARIPEDKWVQNLAGEGYTVPTAIDPGGAAAQALGVGSPGFVVLDRNGTILCLSNDSRAEREVVSALRRVSAW